MATTVYQEGQTDNGFGTAGLVLGIISFVLCFVPLIGLLALPLALLGTVLGGVGLLRASGGRATNFSSSATGLALSMVSGLVVTACIAIIFALGNTTSNVEELKLPSTVYYTNVGLRSTGLHPASRDAVDLGKPVEIPEFAGTGSAGVTVDKFVPDAQSSDEFWTASPGNKLVAAHVIVTNTGQTTYTNASWLGSKVYTNRGQGYDSHHNEAGLFCTKPEHKRNHDKSEYHTEHKGQQRTYSQLAHKSLFLRKKINYDRNHKTQQSSDSAVYHVHRVFGLYTFPAGYRHGCGKTLPAAPFVQCKG